MILNRLKEIRWEKNLTTRQLEKMSGVSHATITRLENGYTYPTQISMLLIARALKMDVSEIFELDYTKLNKIDF